MKYKYSIFIIFIALAIYSCGGDDANLSYEPGIYKPYKQDTVSVYAFTEGRTIDGSSIKPPLGPPSGKVGDIHFIDMDGDFSLGGEAGTKWNSIHLEKKNRAFINCPTCLNAPMQIEVAGDSLFLKPRDLRVVKFSPYSTLGAVPITDPKEAERHATLRAKMIESGFIVTTYDITVRTSSSFKRGGTMDAYYLDIDYLKNELRGKDTLVWVKKETYFRK